MEERTIPPTRNLLNTKSWASLRFFSASACRASSLVAGILVSTVALGTILGINETEELRMAHAIKRGLCFHPDTKEVEIREELLPFRLNLVRERVETKYGFCGITGPTGTGKSLLLDKLGYTMQNVIKIHRRANHPATLSDQLLSTLRSEIFTLPAPLCQVRYSNHRDSTRILKHVFDHVRQKTDAPVTVLIDIPSTPQNLDFLSLANVSWFNVLNNTEILPAALNIETLARDIKFLASDMKIMQCAFVATEEEYLFRYLTRHEPSLHLFNTSELSLDSSKYYLKTYRSLAHVDEASLKRIPRTYSILNNYAEAQDKDLFVRERFNSEVVAVRNQSKEAKKFLQLLLTRGSMYSQSCDSIERNDLLILLSDGLVRLNSRMEFEISFDAVREAVRE